MMPRMNFIVAAEIEQYAEEHTTAPPAHLRALAEETERTTGFLRGMAGDAFGEQFTVGEASEVVDQVGALVDAGLDGLIFNMPLSDPETITRAGELLTGHFA